MKEILPVLALYWGAKIKFDYIVEGKKRTTQNAIVNAETIALIDEFSVNNLYLYLRALKDLQPNHLLHIAQLVTGDKDVKFEYENFENGISVYNAVYWIDIYTDAFTIYASYRESGDECFIPNLVVIVDYLRKNHFDLNGLISRGLAVETI